MPRLRSVLPLLVATAAAVPPGAAAAEFSCGAAAVRGSVLGAPVAPIVANAGRQACANDDGTLLQTGALGLPAAVDVATAATRVTGTGTARRIGAVGQVAGLRVRVVPALPVKLPIADLVTQITPAVSVPVPALLQPLLGPALALDLKPAVAALLGDGTLPAVDLLEVATLSSTGVGGCTDGTPRTGAGSNVTGVKLLGQPIALDRVTGGTANLLDTTSIDPSDLDLAKIGLPLGVTLTGVVQGLIQPVLDALPPIAVPAQLATIKVTPPSQETLANGAIVQRALRVEATLLGRPLVDLAFGEATVGAAGVECVSGVAPTGPDATDLILGCTDADVVLTDVLPKGDRVTLLGVAHKRFAGRRVSIRFRGTGDVVARPVVAPDGSFRARAPLPSRRLRSTDRARYQASVGGERSLDLKLERRMRVDAVTAKGGKVTITGRVSGPLAARAADRRITVERRVSCTRTEVVARVAPRKDGTFRAVVAAPSGRAAAVYRLRTKVRKTTANRKLFPTFTLPRAVDLV